MVYIVVQALNRIQKGYYDAVLGEGLGGAKWQEVLENLRAGRVPSAKGIITSLCCW
jgi:hypothetical protein